MRAYFVVIFYGWGRLCQMVNLGVYITLFKDPENCMKSIEYMTRNI